MADDTLQKLADTIATRAGSDAETSYTKSLLDGGPEKCARKFGEEALETVIAALSEDRNALKAEAADTLYHLLVLLQVRNLPLNEVLMDLEARMGVSGHDEKAGRADVKRTPNKA